MDEIEQYILQYSEDLQQRLREIREIVRESAPNATEKISWGMPTFYLKGNLVHFAMNKLHIGFYPGEDGISYFKEQFQEKGLKHSKGVVQFPLNQPLPAQLIKDITMFRAEQNRNK